MPTADTKRLAPRAAEALASASSKVNALRVVLGLDGFVDEILAVVDKRESPTQFSRVPTIARLAEKLAQAAGKSSNFELVTTQVKLGGNGPNMANALCSFGLPLTYLGNLGHPQIHPVFADFAKIAHVISIANPGHTDALEFGDGKVMLGKHQSLRDVTWDNLIRAVSREDLVKLIDDAALVGFLNWTMLPHLSDVWKHLLADVCPKLVPNPGRLMFFDLADPEKRTADDIREAMQLIGQFSRHFRVILGLNEKESGEICESLGVEAGASSPDGLQQRAATLRAKVGTAQVVIHPTRFAVAAEASTGSAQATTAHVDGPFTATPKLSTGAGDNFNAGYCLGALLGLEKDISLLLGVATSGFYVRNAKSPSIADLTGFLKNWPPPS